MESIIDEAIDNLDTLIFELSLRNGSGSPKTKDQALRDKQLDTVFKIIKKLEKLKGE